MSGRTEREKGRKKNQHRKGHGLKSHQWKKEEQRNEGICVCGRCCVYRVASQCYELCFFFICLNVCVVLCIFLNRLWGCKQSVHVFPCHKTTAAEKETIVRYDSRGWLMSSTCSIGCCCCCCCLMWNKRATSSIKTCCSWIFL